MISDQNMATSGVNYSARTTVPLSLHMLDFIQPTGLTQTAFSVSLKEEDGGEGSQSHVARFSEIRTCQINIKTVTQYPS